jgi:hypothetical protein
MNLLQSIASKVVNILLHKSDAGRLDKLVVPTSDNAVISSAAARMLIYF